MTADENVKIRQAHQVGASIIVTIAPNLVKKYGITGSTFFEESETHDGILLKPRRLA